MARSRSRENDTKPEQSKYAAKRSRGFATIGDGIYARATRNSGVDTRSENQTGSGIPRDKRTTNTGRDVSVANTESRSRDNGARNERSNGRHRPRDPQGELKTHLIGHYGNVLIRRVEDETGMLICYHICEDDQTAIFYDGKSRDHCELYVREYRTLKGYVRP